MLLLNKNKISAGQIAGRFCSSKSNPGVCIVGMLGRLNFFNDNTFRSKFIPYLNRSQFFVFTRTVVELNQDESKVYLDGFDIITEANESLNIIVPYDQIGMNNVLSALNEKQRSGKFYLSLGKVGGYFIVRLDGVGNTYPTNIKSYVPDLPKRIIPKSPVKKGFIVPSQEPEPVQAGVNLEKYFGDPLILIGGAAILFFYVMNR